MATVVTSMEVKCWSIEEEVPDDRRSTVNLWTADECRVAFIHHLCCVGGHFELPQTLSVTHQHQHHHPCLRLSSLWLTIIKIIVKSSGKSSRRKYLPLFLYISKFPYNTKSSTGRRKSLHQDQSDPFICFDRTPTHSRWTQTQTGSHDFYRASRAS